MKGIQLLRQYRYGILDFKGANLHSAHLQAADLTRINLLDFGQKEENVRDWCSRIFSQ